MTYKVVVVGYSQMFASVIAGILASGNKVVGVLRHDRIKYSTPSLWFKDYFGAGNDYSYIKNLELYDIHCKSINSEKFKQELLRLEADFLIIASWGEKLTKSTISLPKIACINVHPALLPKYRGPNPYLQVIKNQEKETGITFHLVDENWDTGEILAQYSVPIMPDDTGKVLRTRCANIAKLGICELLKNFENDTVVPIRQNERFASYYPQITINDVMIDFSMTATEISAQLRAVTDWQPCYTRHKNDFFEIRKFKIFSEKKTTLPPGRIVAKQSGSIFVSTIDNKIIQFINPKLYGKFGYFRTPFYLKYCVKTGDKLS